jgi:hypothetical protein
MKKLLLILGLLTVVSAGAYWWAIVEVQRSPATVQVDDARLRIWYNLVAPNYADTTAANTNLGLDYIGALIHTKTPAAIYFRDTSAAHHKWTILATTPASPIWGLITGTLSSQTDLQTALNAKQNLIALGTTAQYFRGDLSLATFPTDLSSFTNGPGYLTGVNVTMSVTGTGSVATPLKLVGDLASPGANQYYGTDGGGNKGWLANSPILNIYNHDGSLLGDRVVDLAGHHLTFSSAGFNNELQILMANGSSQTNTELFPTVFQSVVTDGTNTETLNIQAGQFAFSSAQGAKFNQQIIAPDSISWSATNSSTVLWSITHNTARLTNIPHANDTTARKPVAVGTDGSLVVMDGWPGSGGGGSSGYSVTTAVNTANYTVPTGRKVFVYLSDLTGQANRNVVLPAATTGDEFVFVNLNTSASTFAWTFTSGTVKDNGQNTITTLTNLTTYHIVFGGTNYQIIN